MAPLRLSSLPFGSLSRRRFAATYDEGDLWLGDDLGQVIAYDDRMAGVAKLLRLRVAAPR